MYYPFLQRIHQASCRNPVLKKKSLKQFNKSRGGGRKAHSLQWAWTCRKIEGIYTIAGSCIWTEAAHGPGRKRVRWDLQPSTATAANLERKSSVWLGRWTPCCPTPAPTPRARVFYIKRSTQHPLQVSDQVAMRKKVCREQQHPLVMKLKLPVVTQQEKHLWTEITQCSWPNLVPHSHLTPGEGQYAWINWPGCLSALLMIKPSSSVTSDPAAPVFCSNPPSQAFSYCAFLTSTIWCYPSNHAEMLHISLL